MKLFILLLFLALDCFASQDPIILPQLLSTNNAVLMTNAEFRVVYGDKLWFKDDADAFKSFRAAQISSNSLAQLHFIREKLEADQAVRDAAASAYLAKQPQILQAQAQRNAEAARVAAFKAEMAKPQSMYLDMKPSERAAFNQNHPHENRSIGNFIGD